MDRKYKDNDSDEREEKSEHEDWKEMDDARRHREYESDRRGHF